ncbi:PIN domain-containing protein [Herbaspirillum seropedicae]|uniref:PIN domain-containing protein n=1 Tax=Herbaspirillum seropedicae TaxID=964 RepID=UPI003F8D1D94
MAGKEDRVEEKKDDSLDTPEAVSEIRKLIESGSLDVISVDTSIFDENKQRLDKGLFSQLQQFGRHPASFVMSDVVYREIKRHLTDHISKSQTRYNRDLTDLCEFVRGDASEVEALKKKLEGMPDANDLCEEQLQQFMDESAAELLQAGDHVTMSELIEIYFNKQPPFQASNLKKSEFPDAIALKTLENWAVKNKREILVVSKDGDWKSFCDQSKHLHLLKDLARALELFQSPDDLVKSILRRLSKTLNTLDLFFAMVWKIN